MWSTWKPLRTELPIGVIEACSFDGLSRLDGLLALLRPVSTTRCLFLASCSGMLAQSPSDRFVRPEQRRQQSQAACVKLCLLVDVTKVC